MFVLSVVLLVTVGVCVGVDGDASGVGVKVAINTYLINSLIN